MYSKTIFSTVWFFRRVEEYNLDKWTWLLIGLVFGKYSLVLWGINMITQGKVSKNNLYRALNPILILLIFSMFIPEFIRYSTSLFMVRFENSYFNGFMLSYNSYLSLVIFGISIILNIVSARMMIKWTTEFQIKGKITWIVATLFLGILPVILFKEFILIWLTQTSTTVRFSRYADDDAIIHCKSHAQATWVLQKLQERMQSCGLELHPD